MHCFKWFWSSVFLFSSLHQDKAHDVNAFVSIISSVRCYVSTRVGVTKASSCTKPDSGITITTIVFVVTNGTDSCPRTASTLSIETLIVTVVLQGGLRTNQRLPRVTTQWGVGVLPVSDQWVQRVGPLVDDNEVDLLTDFHTKTNLGEWCV